MSKAKPLTYAARARNYERQRGRERDPHRMTLDQCTPRQRRRLMHKERRAWRAYAFQHDDDYISAWQDELDDYEPEPYCVTPGCDCSGDDDD